VPEPLVVRREYHPDAPRLATFVGDAAAYIADDVYRRIRLVDPAPAVRAAIEAAEPWASVDRLWELTLERGLRAPGFRMVRGGATLPRSEYCRQAGVGNEQLDDLVEPNRVLELYAGGATVVLQGVQHVDAHFGRLSTNLALELDQPIQVNAYVSPAAAHGLDLHFDYHDVIVVQLAGSKRWRIWEPLERTRRPVKVGRSIPLPRPDEVGEPLFDRTLTPGDCVAIPSGFPHAAETVDDESAHLTIGIMALTWERVLRRLLTQDPSGSALADRLDVAGLGGKYDPSEALEWLAAGLTGERLASEVATAVWRRQPRTRLRPRAADIDVARPLRVTPGPLLWLTADGESARLHLGDRQLVLPAEASDLVADILRTPGSLIAGELAPGLDLPSKEVVLRRLVEEGVLAVA
jgi:lysine-specific demethylase/histidyl-hydroxylase NO66